MQEASVNGHPDEVETPARNGQPKISEAESETQLQVIQEILSCKENVTRMYKVKDEDIVMFIGNTKSGKSTLVNYAIGNELKAVRKNTFPFTMSIVKASDNEEEGPAIGLNIASETTLPTIWSTTQSGIKEKVVDAPGFGDNRGKTQEMANAFYVNEIIRNAKSIKFVLVTEINDILSNNIGAFTRSIDHIDQMFPDTSILNGGMTIVFTKGDGKCSASDICHLLQNVLNEDDMIIPGRSLIKYFSDHEECITFFNMPTVEGSICESGLGMKILDVIENVITGIPRKEFANAKPVVSDQFLSMVEEQICNILVEYNCMLKKVKDGFSRICSKIYEIEGFEKVSRMYAGLLRLERRVHEVTPQTRSKVRLNNLLLRILELENVCGVQDMNDFSNMDVKLEFVEFLDETIGLNKAVKFLEIFYGTIESIRHVITSARQVCEKTLE